MKIMFEAVGLIQSEKQCALRRKPLSSQGAKCLDWGWLTMLFVAQATPIGTEAGKTAVL
jgi:hypothetical protein